VERSFVSVLRPRRDDICSSFKLLHSLLSALLYFSGLYAVTNLGNSNFSLAAEAEGKWHDEKSAALNIITELWHISAGIPVVLTTVIFVVLLTPSRKMSGYYLDEVMAVSCQIFSSSLFIPHAVNRKQWPSLFCVVPLPSL
jgi:hypothetical protein